MLFCSLQVLLPAALAISPGGPWGVFNYAPKSDGLPSRRTQKHRVPCLALEIW
ncbi:uncharacterized protein BT62DRAFT_934707 [Guyanagaster necrorhizus]|uniref:Uncharacterized protein n=1 Tax=Guyanagaster necrorhizus TaxID=856835 RepID=A0A9P7VNK3_9AGAR|nr:uncharacterized protein BT62DRAFT_934707 [Guyanagaster necrorhizus MCA 3950]KAG7443757.1 hypothetical protein BT62DRAFT_934707 [Guyanagaster necrorhizus MCA 3950]